MDQPSTSRGIDCSEASECSICFSVTDEQLVNVSTAKGKEALKKASIERGYGLFANLDFDKNLWVHASCRKEYTHKKNISSAKRKVKQQKSFNISPVKRKLRRSLNSSSELSAGEDAFNWTEDCFICEKEANIEKERKKPRSKRKHISLIESSDFVPNLIKMLMPFNDDYHRNILKRVQSTPSNLRDLQARYHRDCFRQLLNEKHKVVVNPDDSYSCKIDAAIEEICSFMISSHECQFTMKQLIEAVQISDVIPHEYTIRDRLKKRFPDQIVFSSRVGGVTYVCFSDNLYDILTDAWCNKNKPKTLEEKENHLIDSAAELIRKKIRTTVCQTHEYPASDKILSDVNQNIPRLLLRFLNHIICKDKEQSVENEKIYSKRITSIAHAIMSAARLKSFISPLQLAVGITFYRKFGSRNMIELCYQL